MLGGVDAQNSYTNAVAWLDVRTGQWGVADAVPLPYSAEYRGRTAFLNGECARNEKNARHDRSLLS